MHLDRRSHAVLHSTLLAAGLCACLVSSSVALALPEDAKQAVDVSAPGGSSTQADGWTLFKGTANEPARITQGTLVITGLEIRILQKNNELQSASATGNPATFQQQPARDKPLVKGSGKQINLNNATKVVTIDNNGELSQDSKLIQSAHIEFHTDTGESSTGPVRMTLMPKKDDKK